MTKKLEDLFNLPEVEKTSEQMEEKINQLETVSETSVACPTLLNISRTNDVELDELAKQALDGYEMVFDLGLNVEPSKSARLFEVASALLKHSIDAKNMKITNNIKIAELQLKKDKLDQDQKIEDNKLKHKEKIKDINTLENTNLEDILEDDEKTITSNRNNLIGKLRVLKNAN